MISLDHRNGAFALTLAALLGGGCTPDAGREAGLDATYLELLAAEDARPAQGLDLATLIEATTSDRILLRQTAVRALGRLEDPALARHIGSALDDPAPEVRKAAANAMAQAFQTSDGDEALPLLLARWSDEDDPAVRGTLAQSVGRLRLTATNRRLAIDAMIAASFVGEADAPTATITGVVLGLEAIVRGSGDEGLEASAAHRLEALTSYGTSGPEGIDAIRIRTLALSTLAQARRISAGLIERLLRDEAAGVRAAAARYLDVVPASRMAEVIRVALEDPFPQTPIEALRHISRLPRDELYCAYLLAAAAPAVTPSVRIVALDALARPCPDPGVQRALLRETASALGSPTPGGWQTSAHALISLSRLSADDARAVLPNFVSHENAFVRTYAARAARWTEDESALRTLAADREANVKTAAIEGLFTHAGHGVDDVLLEQLVDDDPQLLMTAARLLEGAPDPARVAAAALGALERISRAERETWRDPRRALLESIAELGDTRLSERLIPFLSDYDPLVAGDVEAILEKWNGTSYEAAPRPLTREPLPSVTEFRRMKGATVLLHMQGGGTIEIALHPYLSTTNTFRFIRLVTAGYFDGLTFHRWAPNFVLQGGSPGANEYQGDAMYTRDEVSRQPHWRGTVGISTRGHDTGDGQIFVNLVDNVRLNHDYTIIGTVIEGMDVVDSALEGATIMRAEVRPAT